MKSKVKLESKRKEKKIHPLLYDRMKIIINNSPFYPIFYSVNIVSIKLKV